MNCPNCHSRSMDREVFDGIEIDRCRKCHGLWLDALELEGLASAKPSALISDDARFQANHQPEGSRMNCPKCGGTYLIKLNSRLRPGTIIDSCTVCFGNWLDAGELARLTSGGFRAFMQSLLK